MSKLKKIPDFKSEEEESEFWSTHDSTEYVDYSKGKKALFPNLKPTTRTISIRLPVYLIEEIIHPIIVPRWTDIFQYETNQPVLLNSQMRL